MLCVPLLEWRPRGSSLREPGMETLVLPSLPQRRLRVGTAAQRSADLHLPTQLQGREDQAQKEGQHHPGSAVTHHGSAAFSSALVLSSKGTKTFLPEMLGGLALIENTMSFFFFLRGESSKEVKESSYNYL